VEDNGQFLDLADLFDWLQARPCIGFELIIVLNIGKQPSVYYMNTKYTLNHL